MSRFPLITLKIGKIQNLVGIDSIKIEWRSIGRLSNKLLGGCNCDGFSDLVLWLIVLDKDLLVFFSQRLVKSVESFLSLLLIFKKNWIGGCLASIGTHKLSAIKIPIWVEGWIVVLISLQLSLVKPRKLLLPCLRRILLFEILLKFRNRHLFLINFSTDFTGPVTAFTYPIAVEKISNLVGAFWIAEHLLTYHVAKKKRELRRRHGESEFSGESLLNKGVNSRNNIFLNQNAGIGLISARF
ncbi:hypothetical protein SDC9_112375 [bioreactor metagenome]|uniref:Uncharacterized protein n=1 Tax=bioreactor metagenome TaxID=1076179 RepID=A0A645BK54_9ZZZZ